MLYTIIDVETTGGRPERDRITEIAIAQHDGERVLHTWGSLINPECSIPWNITMITGITDEMVAQAPKFYEVAKTIVELTQGSVFVAHNAPFDYGFVQQEFRRLGYAFSRQQLCTVRLGRRHLPGLRSYSLENLIRHFGIAVERRHRALDDVLATCQVFERIMAASGGSLLNDPLKAQKLPPSLSLERLQALPEGCGVYYFYDEQGQVVYVGKSINIRKRVFEHFAGPNKKAIEMYRSVADIGYHITGSELAALLLESQEIKHLQPRINRAQRTKHYPFIIHQQRDEAGYIHLDVARANKREEAQYRIVSRHGKLSDAKGTLRYLLQQYALCEKLCHLSSGSGACFLHHVRKCAGACAGKEGPDAYNARAEQAILHQERGLEGSFLIVDAGRSPDEKTIVLVEEGHYRGFGHVQADWPIASPEAARDAIRPMEDNPETARLIRLFLEQNRHTRILRF